MKLFPFYEKVDQSAESWLKSCGFKFDSIESLQEPPPGALSVLGLAREQAGPEAVQETWEFLWAYEWTHYNSLGLNGCARACLARIDGSLYISTAAEK